MKQWFQVDGKDGNIMTLLELNEKVSSLKTQIEALKDQMKKIYDNKDIKTTVMSKEYYRLLKERQRLEAELRPLWNEQSRLRREIRKNSHTQEKIFVNSYGEATKREITSATYQTAQKRMEQVILHNMGM